MGAPLPTLILTLALLLGLQGPLLAQPSARTLAPQRIAAVVNDDVVSLQDLNERLHLVLITSGVADTPETRRRLAPQVLRGLIEETLQLQEAERLDIQITEEELERALANIARRNDLTIEEMSQFLRDNGIDPETLRRQLRAQIAWVKVVNRQIRPRVTVTLDQLELAVAEARENQGQPELLLGEIVLPVDSPGQEGEVAADAQRLVQTLREGADFGSLARQVSAAASAEQGGDVGWVPAARIPPELLQTLDQMEPGEISPPIKSSVGYHIFWLRDRRQTRPAAAATDDREVRLTQILFPADEAADAPRLGELRADAAALRERLSSCSAMVETARELDAPASGDLGWIRLADLPGELAQPLAALEVGEVSPPLRGPAGIHLLMVCERRGGQEGAGSGLDRDAIEQRLENERIERLARRYLRDLRKQAFVEVRI